jgi:hypothetical protein
MNAGDDDGNRRPNNSSWTAQKNRRRSPPTLRRCPRWSGITVHFGWNTQLAADRDRLEVQHASYVGEFAFAAGQEGIDLAMSQIVVIDEGHEL